MARVLEIVYAIMGVLTGGCMIGLAKAQGVQMTEKGAAMTLVRCSGAACICWSTTA